jgi:HEAT repeat protein
VRHNATSLLARVANEHPAAVEPATDALVARLDDDLAGTRLNACWALNYLEADQTVSELEELAANDPDEDVRRVARMAVEALED